MLKEKKVKQKTDRKTRKNEFFWVLNFVWQKKSEERKDQQGISRRVSKIKNDFFAHKWFFKPENREKELKKDRKRKKRRCHPHQFVEKKETKHEKQNFSKKKKERRMRNKTKKRESKKKNEKPFFKTQKKTKHGK